MLTFVSQGEFFMISVLSIGNSFSQDAHRYVHRIARAAGVELDMNNLYIGGCSLEQHFVNMEKNKRAYELERNGEPTGQTVSLRQVLRFRQWDVVTLQQVSHLAPNYDTYQPYLNELAGYVRGMQPHAKVVMHQTWAYEATCPRLKNEVGYDTPGEMTRAIEHAYAQAAADIHANGTIPSGALFQALLRSNITALYRDGYHASLGLGRYALGLLWMEELTGRSAVGNTMDALDEPADGIDFELVQNIVHDTAKRYPIF